MAAEGPTRFDDERPDNEPREENPPGGELLQKVLDGIAEPILVVRKDYSIQLVNRAARELFDPEKGVATCFEFSHRGKEPCPKENCSLERTRETGRPVTFLHEHFSKDGARRLDEIYSFPIYGQDGQFEGIIEYLHDVTGMGNVERERKKELTGLLIVCAWCRRIREEGRWMFLEEFVETYTEARCSHSICPDCLKRAWEAER